MDVILSKNKKLIPIFIPHIFNVWFVSKIVFVYPAIELVRSKKRLNVW